MSGRAAKQSYLGRVIGPAKFHNGQNGSKPYLSFAVFVDRLAVRAENKKERTSGKIFCSYSVQSEDDPVAFILCNIIDSKTGSGSLNGHTYKSVEVWVEGNEKLTEVKAFDGSGQELSGAYYKSLEYCSVQILDRNLIKLLKQGQEGENENSSEAQANVAPGSTASRVTVQPAQAAPNASTQPKSKKTYAAGDKITHEGKTFEFLGGDPSNMSNWTEVDEDTTPTAPFAVSTKASSATPVQAAPTANANPFRPNGSSSTGQASSIRSMLEEDGGSEGPAFGSSNRPPV